MLINTAAEGNVNNLIQTTVQHPAFRETINSIKSNSRTIMLIASAKIPECEGSISPVNFYGQLTISHTC